MYSFTRLEYVTAAGLTQITAVPRSTAHRGHRHQARSAATTPMPAMPRTSWGSCAHHETPGCRRFHWRSAKDQPGVVCVMWIAVESG